MSDSPTTGAIAAIDGQLTFTQTPEQSGKGMARVFSRSGRPSDPTEAAEAEALDRLREILYSAESDIGLPPQGMAAAIGSFFFQAEDGIRDGTVTGVQTCALPI